MPLPRPASVSVRFCGGSETSWSRCYEQGHIYRFRYRYGYRYRYRYMYRYSYRYGYRYRYRYRGDGLRTLQLLRLVARKAGAGIGTDKDTGTNCGRCIKWQ